MDGCNRHLGREKAYFRRYRCCMNHSKQAQVLVDGEIKRWCQQCCCFHELHFFDGDRRCDRLLPAPSVATVLLLLT